MLGEEHRHDRSFNDAMMLEVRRENRGGVCCSRFLGGKGQGRLQWCAPYVTGNREARGRKTLVDHRWIEIDCRAPHYPVESILDGTASYSCVHKRKSLPLHSHRDDRCSMPVPGTASPPPHPGNRLPITSEQASNPIPIGCHLH